MKNKFVSQNIKPFVEMIVETLLFILIFSSFDIYSEVVVDNPNGLLSYDDVEFCKIKECRERIKNA